MATNRGLLSTREQITDQLREAVFAGKLIPGERVSEMALAEQFGVSRGPIREALSQLTTEGLFIAKQNCGVTVAHPAPEPIRDLILPLRRTLEVFAFNQIFDSLNTDDFRYWDDLVFRMERVCRQGDWQSQPQLDIEFHRYLLERASSSDLLAIWQTIITRMREHFWITVRDHHARGELMYMHAHHLQLLNVFRAGSQPAAVRALEMHIAEN